MNMLDRAVTQRPVHPLLWITMAAMVLPELMFAAVDAGLLSPALGRPPVFVEFAFWDVMFDYALAGEGVHIQLLWSPLTHAFLHGGWLHLVMNGAAFLGLGHFISQSAGIRATAWIFLATAVSGAVVYGLISTFNGPMVGASGVVFGFLGVVTCWQEQALRRRGLDRSPIWMRILGLVAINAVMDFGLGGLLAWEAHLGGFVAGWLMAYRMRPRRPRPAWQREPWAG